VALHRGSCSTIRSVSWSASCLNGDIGYELENANKEGVSYKVVRKLEAWKIGICIFEVNNYQLLVFIRREKQRRLSSRHESQDVAVLSL
jgi:hypothetical protein